MRRSAFHHLTLATKIVIFDTPTTAIAFLGVAQVTLVIVTDARATTVP